MLVPAFGFILSLSFKHLHKCLTKVSAALLGEVQHFTGLETHIYQSPLMTIIVIVVLTIKSFPFQGFSRLIFFSCLHFWISNFLLSFIPTPTDCPTYFYCTSFSLPLQTLLPSLMQLQTNSGGGCDSAAAWPARVGQTSQQEESSSFGAPSCRESGRWDSPLASSYSWTLSINVIFHIICSQLLSTLLVLLTMSKLPSRWHLPLTSTSAHHVPKGRTCNHFL